MKYLFGDSSELPVQIDFLRLLNNYIETSVKVITLENTVFDLKETIMDRRRLKNSVLDEMDNFLMTVENAIFGAVAKSKEQETIVKYADKSKQFLKKFIEDGKTQFSDELFLEIAQYEKKVDEVDNENRTILESFFSQDPLPVTNKKYILRAVEKGYSSNVQVDCEGNIACIFDIRSNESPFWKNHPKSRDFVKNVEIPAKMKKPFLKNELVPDIVKIDDFRLTDLVLSGNELEVVFRKSFDAASERFRLKMVFTGEFSVEVLHADEGEVEKNINAIPELKNELNTLRLRELGEKIIEKTKDLYIKKHRLENIYIGGIDVLEENRIFELMQKVADIFAPTVADIKKHSPSKEELSLKTEDESGKRSEIYLKKSEVRGKLDAIGEKGMKLFEILGIQQ
jgi:hypothetical protein